MSTTATVLTLAAIQPLSCMHKHCLLLLLMCMFVTADAVFSQAIYHVMEIMPTDPGDMASCRWDLLQHAISLLSLCC